MEPGAANLHVDTTINTHALSLGGSTYRFFLTGSYSTGVVDVTFAAASITDVAGPHNTQGYANAAQTMSFTALGPTASLMDPGSDSTVSPVGLNDEGYIDVPFTLSAGGTLDPSTIANASTVFTLSGSNGFAIDDTKAPVLISQVGSVSVYRYWTTGAYTTGTVEIDFLPGSPFTGPVAPVNFMVDGVATPNLHYLDVQLTPTAGNTLDLATITDTAPEFALTGAGAAGVQLVTDAAPTEGSRARPRSATTSAAPSPRAPSRSPSPPARSPRTGSRTPRRPTASPSSS